jgi:NDP-sugar pyrophosphorylase family protein
MVADPVTVGPDTPVDEVIELMRSTTLYQIPVVDAERHLLDLHLLETLNAQRTERVAVVMAGGLGVRLRPLTDTLPKPLLEISGRPILFILLDQLLSQGFNRVWVTVNYLREKIADAIAAEPRYTNVVRLVHEEERMGTAGALSLLPERPRNPFLVVNADLLTKVPMGELLRFHLMERNQLTVALKEERFTVPYGVAALEGTRVLRMDEKPSMTFFLNTGVYAVAPEVLDRIPAGQFYDMPDVVNALLKDGKRVGCFPVHEYWLDIGLPSQLERAGSDYDRHFAPTEAEGAES